MKRSRVGVIEGVWIFIFVIVLFFLFFKSLIWGGKWGDGRIC